MNNNNNKEKSYHYYMMIYLRGLELKLYKIASDAIANLKLSLLNEEEEEDDEQRLAIFILRSYSYILFST